MKLQFRIPLVALMMASTGLCFSQDKSPVNFDKVTAKDFSLEGINADTSYGAIILADVGKSTFEANSKGWFSLVFKRQRRIKIISKKGFDIATVSIPLYKSRTTDDEEVLDALKAVTYNLVNGKVEETKLDKGNVFKEVQDRNHSLRKFTMPAVKEGSIIDVSYTINSDFLFNLQSWSFQGSYPRLWSEYEVSIPEFFKYVMLTTGSTSFHINNAKEKFQGFNIRIPTTGTERAEVVSLNSTNVHSRWVMKDVPAIREETFTSTIDNHLSRIDFQMSGQKFPNMPYKDIMGSWEKAALDLTTDKDFIADFKADNKWLNETLQTLQADNKDLKAKASAIFYYVQKNFNSNGFKGIYLSQSLKETFKTKKGFVPDINLLLTLMLTKAGFDANPVILSTRANGFPTAQYPIIGRYNYVISKVYINGVLYFLDASHKQMGFGKLPSYCYNGVAASITMLAPPEILVADSLTEKKIVGIVLTNDETNKNSWIGRYNSSLGYYESTELRSDIETKGQDAYTKKVEESAAGDFEISEVKLTDLTETEKPLQVSYAIKMDRDSGSNLIYLNPFVRERLKENYFKSAERIYPVELPYKIDELYSLYMEIPDGYVIDEVPKSARVSLNENEGMFEYLISKSAQNISLQCRIKINKPVFNSDEYESLKNFFDYIVKKQSEQIVLKKK